MLSILWERLHWPIIIIALAVLISGLIDYFALSSIDRIHIIGKADKDSQLRVYYSNGIAKPVYRQKNSILFKPLEIDTKTELVQKFNNRIVRRLRLDPSDKPGKLKIYEIKFTSVFGNPITFDANDIFNNFRCNSQCSLEVLNGYVEVVSSGSDPQLELKKNLRFNNPFFRIIIPVFLAILLSIPIRKIRLKNIYAISDIRDKKPSSIDNIAALDGLRGFAALLVLADHTNYTYFKGLGAIGVWLFFCLSGFLLSIPFVKNPALINSPGYMQHYLSRRVLRILPMYYVIIIYTYLVQGKLDDFVRHALFIQGDGILWSIPQEMFFYMLLPIILFINFFCCRGNQLLMISVNLLLVVLFGHFFDVKFIYIYGNNARISLWISVFLTGVLLSYFYYSPYIKFIRDRSIILHNLIGIALFCMVVFSSNGVLNQLFRNKETVFYTWKYVEIYGYISALLILFTIINNKLWINKLMSLYPLRAVGIVGFSFYLLHPIILQMIRVISNNMYGYPLESAPLFLVGAFATYVFSVLTYSLIERPFLKVRLYVK